MLVVVSMVTRFTKIANILFCLENQVPMFPLAHLLELAMTLPSGFNITAKQVISAAVERCAHCTESTEEGRLAQTTRRVSWER